MTKKVITFTFEKDDKKSHQVRINLSNATGTAHRFTDRDRMIF